MNAKTVYLLSCFMAVMLWWACIPKTTEQLPGNTETTTSTTATPKPAQENLSPCPKFSDAPNPDDVETNYVLYRDFLRANDWNQAFEYWKKVYAVAPAADGQRNTVFADGIRFYEYFITQDSTKKDEYIGEIFKLYDEIEKCYPEGGYVAGRKAFDLYYNFPERASRDEIFQLFKASLDEDGEEANDFVINPFTALLVEQYFENKISMAEAQRYTAIINELVKKGLAECEGTDCERWKIIEGYALVRLEAFETVQGFYDCNYYVEKYYGEFEENPQDCDVIRTVYSRLKFGGCPETNEKFKALIAAGNANCVEAGPLELAYTALREARYNDAVTLFEDVAAQETNPERKADILLLIAKVYDAHLKNYGKARQYALQAAAVNPNWGEPYILIGRLYASSGPLCGPGRGWDSQIVVWPAIDMWNKAKRVDPSVAAEANKWINTYTQYMPKREDIFFRNLKAGDSYRVGCWIQESTTIRTSD